MTKKLMAALLLFCLSAGILAGCGGSSDTAGEAPAETTEAAEGEEGEGTGQAITVGGETYERFVKALMAQTEDSITMVLGSDIQLEGSAVVFGTTDYDGLLPEAFTVVPTDVTIDLNGYTITGEEDCPLFAVQDGYTLTIIDSSAEQTGQLVTHGETDVEVEAGGTYNAPEAE